MHDFIGAEIPVSVYRLQFGPLLNFRQARELVPYLNSLGIEAVYASPYFQSRKGSAHGYNIVRPNCLNPELGSEKDYDDFCSALKEHKMKQIIDIVPNHMGILGDNPYWRDVLENGPASIYAPYFDINWNPPRKELRNKVLMPVLGDQYGVVLENAELRLVYERGEFFIHYWDHVLPIAPKSYPRILELRTMVYKEQLSANDPSYLECLNIISDFNNLPDREEQNPARVVDRNRDKEIAKEKLAELYEKSESFRCFLSETIEIFNGKANVVESFDLLDDLLNEQPYRLAYWRVASEEINYRRFFDVNELAAIRVENEDVFQFHHQKIFELLENGKVHGLRIDHPDGLYDPERYFRRLQENYLSHKKGIDAKNVTQKISQVIHHEDLPLYVVIEKILDRKEDLPNEWKVHGTVGYEYLNLLNQLFINNESEEPFNRIYRKFSLRDEPFEEKVYQKKKLFALINMASEINHLGLRLRELSEKIRRYRDFTLVNLTVALREVIACFPVYRTYISPTTQKVSERDRKLIEVAVSRAKSKTPSLVLDTYDFIEKILLLEIESTLSERDRSLARDIVLRFQQLSAPVMAKGLEDTVFYSYNRLISLNEVGGDPENFGATPTDFHRQNHERLRTWRGNFIATDTHDTKRSEDIRMRVNVLTEMPEEWESRVLTWQRWNARLKSKMGDVFIPDNNVEYFIYQTLLGVWPDRRMSDEKRKAFLERMKTYFLKAMREAKTFTNWVNPNESYESKVLDFCEAILLETDENPFLRDFKEFQKEISLLAKQSVLSAIVLRAGSPGVFDLYQGSELWRYSLVDPDNRRAIRYERREKILDHIEDTVNQGDDRRPWINRAISMPEESEIKFYVLRECLQLRKTYREVFLTGEYIPLDAQGIYKNNVVVFVRKLGDTVILFVGSRFLSQVKDEAGKVDWKDTEIILPSEYVKGEKGFDVLMNREHRFIEGENSLYVKCSELFKELNAGIWVFNSEK